LPGFRQSDTLYIRVAARLSIKVVQLMLTLAIVCQVIIAAGIFNVWVLRPGKPTPWRGGESSTMAEEFRVYGLPDWMMKVTGAAKMLLAGLLLVGIWYPPLVVPAAAAMGLLMIGAITMHVRVKDPLKRSLPAFSMLVMTVIILTAHA
jgi:hypothetical protein